MDELQRRARGRGSAPAARFLPRAAAMLGAAVVCAVVSNALAGPERHLLWVGDYDSAPARPGAPTPAPPAAQPSAGAAAAGSASTRAFPPHPEKPWVEISGDDVL